MRVYFDMDGVVADLFGVLNKRWGSYKNLSTEDWIDCFYDEDFWLNLPVGRGANTLINYVVNRVGSYSIITAVEDTYDKCIHSKVEWVKNNLEIKPYEIIFEVNKSKRALPGDILIDDRRHNLLEWESAGGIGIKYKCHSERSKYRVSNIIQKLNSVLGV